MKHFEDDCPQHMEEKTNENFHEYGVTDIHTNEARIRLAKTLCDDCEEWPAINVMNQAWLRIKRHENEIQELLKLQEQVEMMKLTLQLAINTCKHPSVMEKGELNYLVENMEFALFKLENKL